MAEKRLQNTISGSILEKNLVNRLRILEQIKDRLHPQTYLHLFASCSDGILHYAFVKIEKKKTIFQSTLNQWPLLIVQLLDRKENGMRMRRGQWKSLKLNGTWNFFYSLLAPERRLLKVSVLLKLTVKVSTRPWWSGSEHTNENRPAKNNIRFQS